MNPFGEDDEDFELNYLLDRHTEIAYLLAGKVLIKTIFYILKFSLNVAERFEVLFTTCSVLN